MSTIYVAGAGWCEYTRMATKKINTLEKPLRDRFTILNCSHTEGEKGFKGRDDSNSAPCKELKKQKLGFPTFMKCDNDTCSVVRVGHTDDLQKEVLEKASSI